MYGEFFDIPAPDELVFLSSFTGGEVFRSGMHLQARPREDLLLPAPATRTTPSTSTRASARSSPTPCEWAVTVRPERTDPVLLRYDTEDFYNGHGLPGRARPRDRAGVIARARRAAARRPRRRRRHGQALAVDDPRRPGRRARRASSTSTSTAARRPPGRGRGRREVPIGRDAVEARGQHRARRRSSTSPSRGAPPGDDGRAVRRAAGAGGEAGAPPPSRRRCRWRRPRRSAGSCSWSASRGATTPTSSSSAPRPRCSGELGSLSTEFFKAPHFGGFRDEMAQPLLVDMAIHQFDLARFLLDAEPVSVYCESWNPPWSWYAGDASAAAVFEMSAGARYVLHGSPGARRGPRRRGTAPGGCPGRTARRSGTATTPPCWRPSGVPGGFTDPGKEIAGSLAAFTAFLREGRPFSGEVHENVLSLAMVEAAVESAATGTRVLRRRRPAARLRAGPGRGAARRRRGRPEGLALRPRGPGPLTPRRPAPPPTSSGAGAVPRG